MSAAELADLLQESGFDSWESVTVALELWSNTSVTGQAQWLIQHLLETKQQYWALIAEALGIALPRPDDLVELMGWEVGAVNQFNENELLLTIAYGERLFTVASLIRFNARHSVWHAGQLSALARTT